MVSVVNLPSISRTRNGRATLYRRACRISHCQRPFQVGQASGTLAAMKTKTAWFILLCLASLGVHAKDAPLFRKTSNGGMVYQEVERTAGASTVEATQPTGTAVAKSMFLLRATCALMKVRGKEAFTIERLPTPAVRFVVHFVAAPSGPGAGLDQPIGAGSVISVARCDAIEAVLVQASKRPVRTQQQ